MSEFQLNRKTGPAVTVVTEVVYELNRGDQILSYKEWLNQKGKVVDSELRDVDGDLIVDDELMDEVQAFVDSNPKIVDKCGVCGSGLPRNEKGECPQCGV